MNDKIASSSSTTSTTTIFDLPEVLLIHILSFLYLPEAIQTSILSSKFKTLWHSIPNLHFNILEFYSRGKSLTARCDHSRNLFADFVSHTLFLRTLSPLTKFVLTFEYTNYERHKFHVTSWVKHVVVNLRVKEMHLDFRNLKFGRFRDLDDLKDDDDGTRLFEYEFHLMDIYRGCVEELRLYACSIMVPPITCNAKFVSLRSLVLSVYALEYEDVCDLITRCVNLEVLELIDLEFSEAGCLVIHSGVLKELRIDSCCIVQCHWGLDLDIWCPSLEKIRLANLELGKYVIRGTERLVEAFVDFSPFFGGKNYSQSWKKLLKYFTNISSLRVWEKLLESNEVPAGCKQMASNIKHLELYWAYNESDIVGLAALLKLLPKLEILGLCNTGVCDANLHKDHMKASTFFNMPRLKKVILRKYRKSKSELHFIKLFEKSGIVEIKLILLNKQEEDKQYKGTTTLERRIEFDRT